MASYLMDMNIIFQECVWPILIFINTLKWRFFEYALTQERIGTVFSGVQPVCFNIFLKHPLVLENDYPLLTKIKANTVYTCLLFEI